MKIITGPRRSGKTTELIKRSRQYPNPVILCRNASTAKKVHNQGVEMGMEVETASYWEFLRGRYRGDATTVLIDDLDAFIRVVVQDNCGGKLGEVAMTPTVMSRLEQNETY